MNDKSQPLKLHQFPINKSTFETIDIGVYNWIINNIQPFTNTFEGHSKVPIIWASAERAFQIKDNVDLRDGGGKLKLPLISLERTNISKDANFKGKYYSIIPTTSKDYKGGNAYFYGNLINQLKTSEFANADAKRQEYVLGSQGLGTGQENRRYKNKKIVYEVLSGPTPVYLKITYTLNFKSEYQQQMNDMLIPFLTRNGQSRIYPIFNDGHRYELFLKGDSLSFSNNSQNLQENERIFITKMTFDVLGYLLGNEETNEQPIVTIRETFVDFKLSRERIVKVNSTELF